MSKITKRLDPRVYRTRKLLRDALINLVPQKGYMDITIQDITDEATLNRATFYLHFKDKDELLLNVFDYLVQEAIPEPPSQDGSEMADPAGAIAAMLDHVRGYADFYRVMLGEQGVPAFMARVRVYIDQIVLRWLEATVLDMVKEPVITEVLINYIGSAYLGVISWWLEREMPYSIEEMQQQLILLTRFGIEGLLHGNMENMILDK